MASLYGLLSQVMYIVYTSMYIVIRVLPCYAVGLTCSFGIIIYTRQKDILETLEQHVMFIVVTHPAN